MAKVKLEPTEVLGGLRREAGEAPLPGATWYVAEARGDGLVYRFPAGALAKARYLTADLLLDGDELASYALYLKEGEEGPQFQLLFHLLNQCQARLRLPLEAVEQKRHKLTREGALLFPASGGERVDLRKVDRLTLLVSYKANDPPRFCLTPFEATEKEPPFLADPVLPKGPLLDELGQCTLREWPEKSRSAEEVTERLAAQLAAAEGKRQPGSFSRWGGSKEIRFEGTGFFRTHHDGRRWWLVDPEGHAFWSSGLDCMLVELTTAVCGGLEKALAWTPDREGPYAAIFEERAAGESRREHSVNYLTANLIRAFGPEQWHEQWMKIAAGELRGLGFNTVGNWSDRKLWRESGMPYVRPLDRALGETPLVFRSFPDVFAPGFEEEAAAFAEQLRETRDDPALIGYFLMNEPDWGFAEETPAAGMLFTVPSCASRRALGEFLRERHGSDAALSAAWGMKVTLGAVAEGEWRAPLTEAAKAELEAFSTVMVDRFFRTLGEACRRVDPNHLNLGVRPHAPPPRWALEGMRSFDVFSANCYRPRVRAEFGEVSAYLERPVLVGEWHFGSLDAGLTCSGLASVPDEESRGRAYRVYLEDAAAKPWCVGAHWFQMYDESMLGRFDGENYNFGFYDVCHRRYEPLGAAARQSHERLYQVAAGEVEPFSDAPEYLPGVYG